MKQETNKKPHFLAARRDSLPLNSSLRTTLTLTIKMDEQQQRITVLEDKVAMLCEKLNIK